MKVYSLMARTRSEMRAVLLSIWSSNDATSSEAAMRTNAARAVSPLHRPEQVLEGLRSTLRRDRSAANCHRSVLPWFRSTVSISSSRLLQGQTAQWRFGALLHQEAFQLFNLRFLRLRKLARAKLMAGLLDPFQCVAQLAGGPPPRR